jgi:hypothetical protein
MKWEKVTKDGVEQETPEVPEAISFIKLMLYDENRPQDVLAASMYFNTMSSKSQNDSYLDRLVQAKAMVKLYQLNLDANRKNIYDASTKKKQKAQDWHIHVRRGSGMVGCQCRIAVRRGSVQQEQGHRWCSCPRCLQRF